MPTSARCGACSRRQERRYEERRAHAKSPDDPLGLCVGSGIKLSGSGAARRRYRERVQSPALLKLDLRHLEALQAVACSGSFAAAADSLGYTQSAISQQIAALEGAVGQRLVARSSGGRGSSLTPAGEVVLRHADAVLARLQLLAGD